jgi:hypothetical protein
MPFALVFLENSGHISNVVLRNCFKNPHRQEHTSLHPQNKLPCCITYNASWLVCTSPWSLDCELLKAGLYLTHLSNHSAWHNIWDMVEAQLSWILMEGTWAPNYQIIGFLSDKKVTDLFYSKLSTQSYVLKHALIILPGEEKSKWKNQDYEEKHSALRCKLKLPGK